ncbi:MAG: response regulator [Lachnospiraceae bacterium]|nr:response regulator [Lachnospiraceae bacterium]
MEKIMIVDDNMANLIMARKTLEDTYEVIPVSSGISALECLHDMPDLPVLLLLDIDMPNVNGFQVISEMKNNKKIADIPVIFLTAQDDDITELEGYNLGASDYIKKPYTANLLRKRVDIQIQLLNQKNKLADYNANLTASIQEKVKRFVELQYSVVEMFVTMMEKKDVRAGLHAKRIEKDMDVFLSALVRQETVSYSADDCATISFAAKIHDIGKLCVKDTYIESSENPSSKSKPFEIEAAKVHTSLGAEIISQITQLASNNSNFMTYALNMCKYHHENWDGSGYPEKLSGEKIPMEARILSIVDYYDNLRYSNKYGKQLTHSEALMKIKFLKFTMFDQQLVNVFLSCSSEIANVNP